MNRIKTKNRIAALNITSRVLVLLSLFVWIGSIIGISIYNYYNETTYELVKFCMILLICSTFSMAITLGLNKFAKLFKVAYKVVDGYEIFVHVTYRKIELFINDELKVEKDARLYRFEELVYDLDLNKTITIIVSTNPITID